MNPIIFTVEGNIGSGKSTFLKTLSSKINSGDKRLHILQEPVDEWFKIKNEEEKSLFELFYNDPKRYSYLFQTYIFYTRFNKFLNIPSNEIVICERCVLTDYNVFLKSLYESNDISLLEYKVFTSWFNLILDISKFKLHGIIYIQAKPEVCNDRIKKRNRNGEDGITLQYLELLHKKHELWLNEVKDTNVFFIDGNRTEVDIVSDTDLYKKLQKFIKDNGEIKYNEN